MTVHKKLLIFNIKKFSTKFDDLGAVLVLLL